MEIIDGRLTGTTNGHFPQDFTVATEAEKPTNPAVGDKISVTGTGKEYTCFVANVWSLVIGPCYDEYSNHMGTVDNVMKTNTAGNATLITDSATPNHEMDISTGVTSSAYGIYHCNKTVLLTDSFEFNVIVKNLVSGADGTRWFKIGFSDYISFRQTNEGSWFCYTSDGVASETTNISDIVSGDLLTIKNYGSVIMYFVNGIIVATHTGISLISKSESPSIDLRASIGTTTARSCSVDYIGLKVFK